MKHKTKFTNKVGRTSYPIYLIVKDENAENNIQKYDLWCEKEIYAMAWWDIYEESIIDFEENGWKD